jgi:predicted metal-dependent RNase
MRWIQSARTLPKAIIVTHGEPESSAAFAQRIEKETGIRCHVPALGEAYDLEDWLQS